MINSVHFYNILEYYFKIFFTENIESNKNNITETIKSFFNTKNLSQIQIYDCVIKMINPANLDYLINKINEVFIYFDDKRECLNTLEIITEMRKYDMKIVSEEAVKSYCANLISQFIFFHVNKLKGYYEVIARISSSIISRKIDINDKEYLRLLIHIKNCLLNILQYKILKLFLFNVMNRIKKIKLDKINKEDVVKDYFTYINCISNMNRKISKDFDSFSPLVINKEIEYFINQYNPKYNKICVEILGGEEIVHKNEKDNDISIDPRAIFIKQFSENPKDMLTAMSEFANRTERNMAIILTILELIGNACNVYSTHNKSKSSLPSNSNIIFNISKEGISSVGVNGNNIDFIKQTNVKK